MGNASKRKGRLRRIDLLRIFLRSFLIQASWNYRGMLNLGFLFTIRPGLSRLFEREEDRQAAALRHAGFFNTHPYMASYAIGATLAAEEEAIERGDGDTQSVLRLKRSLCGPLGALGDNLFWGHWRPVCAVIGVLGAYLWGLWGPVLFLALYNVPHVGVRYRGLVTAYQDRKRFVDDLGGALYRTAPALSERLGAFFTGCLVVLFVGYRGDFDLQTRLYFLGALLATLLLLMRSRRIRSLGGAIFLFLATLPVAGGAPW